MQFLIILFLGMTSTAQESLQDLEKGGIWKQQGSLVSVQIVKGEPLRIYVAGKDEGKLDLTDLKLTVRRLKPYPAQDLVAERSGDHYVVSNSHSASHLEVTAQVKAKAETLKFNLKEKP